VKLYRVRLLPHGAFAARGSKPIDEANMSFGEVARAG